MLLRGSADPRVQVVPFGLRSSRSRPELHPRRCTRVHRPDRRRWLERILFQLATFETAEQGSPEAVSSMSTTSSPPPSRTTCPTRSSRSRPAGCVIRGPGRTYRCGIVGPGVTGRRGRGGHRRRHHHGGVVEQRRSHGSARRRARSCQCDVGEAGGGAAISGVADVVDRGRSSLRSSSRTTHWSSAASASPPRGTRSFACRIRAISCPCGDRSSSPQLSARTRTGSRTRGIAFIVARVSDPAFKLGMPTLVEENRRLPRVLLLQAALQHVAHGDFLLPSPMSVQSSRCMCDPRSWWRSG